MAISIVIGINGLNETLMGTPGVHSVTNRYDRSQHAMLSATQISLSDFWDGEVVDWARDMTWHSVEVSETTYLDVLLKSPSFMGACIQQWHPFPFGQTLLGILTDDFMWDTDMFLRKGSETSFNHPHWPLGFAMPGVGRCMLLPVEWPLLSSLGMGVTKRSADLSSPLLHDAVIREIHTKHMADSD